MLVNRREPNFTINQRDSITQIISIPKFQFNIILQYQLCSSRSLSVPLPSARAPIAETRRHPSLFPFPPPPSANSPPTFFPSFSLPAHNPPYTTQCYHVAHSELLPRALPIRARLASQASPPPRPAKLKFKLKLHAAPAPPSAAGTSPCTATHKPRPWCTRNTASQRMFSGQSHSHLHPLPAKRNSNQTY